MKNDSLGDRMKRNYENCYRLYLTRRTPVIVRVDGKAFHSLPLKKPFDDDFMTAMVNAAMHTAKEMQGFKLGYVQSDEASFLLTDFEDLTTEAWFGYNLQKIVSVTAALMTEWFHYESEAVLVKSRHSAIVFDTRAFNMPEGEVANYFLWRAKDWERNSVQMYCQSHFSHKDLDGKGRDDQHEMLYSMGKNWATDLTEQQRNGTFFAKDFWYHNIQPTFAVINGLVEDVMPIHLR